ncbi:MAG: CRISPR-associated helicase Cas3', partial [Planctomycetota bacterium]
KNIARIIFLYPTRGTANEGFRDYISWAPEADAALVHSTSAYELSGMFENPNDERSRKDFTTNDRLFALAYWQRRIFSATVDQFLGFMQHSYRSICLLPLLVDSVIVIDEVHSFDKSLFSVLKKFLNNFDVPVLCMTASLTYERQKELIDCSLTVFPQKEYFKDLKILTEMPRYNVHFLDNIDEVKKIIKNFTAKKVLWVVNTVSRCQKLGIEFKEALCYHSRFKISDRKRHHDNVISVFKPEQSHGILAITTQVCEMSLDLDADIIISEIAPITSIIQRMGRCNRHAHPEDNKIGEVYLYKPENSKPYKEDDMKGLDEFIKGINCKKISQDDLGKLLEQYGPSEIEVERYAAFLESGPWAVTREESLREDDKFTVQAILDTDINDYLQCRSEKKPTDGLLVPVPYHCAERDNRIGNWPFVTDSSHYDARLGFLDKLKEKI